jgi:hypothetical protein
VRPAGQALGRPRAAIVQVRVVLPGEPDTAEKMDGGFRHAAVGLARPQRGDVGGHPGLGRAVRTRDRGVPGGRRDGLQVREHVDARVSDRLERADRAAELLAVLHVLDARVQAPADAAGRFGGRGEQEFVLGPVQDRDRGRTVA